MSPGEEEWAVVKLAWPRVHLMRYGCRGGAAAAGFLALLVCGLWSLVTAGEPRGVLWRAPGGRFRHSCVVFPLSTYVCGETGAHLRGCPGAAEHASEREGVGTSIKIRVHSTQDRYRAGTGTRPHVRCAVSLSARLSAATAQCTGSRSICGVVISAGPTGRAIEYWARRRCIRQLLVHSSSCGLHEACRLHAEGVLAWCLPSTTSTLALGQVRVLGSW